MTKKKARIGSSFDDFLKRKASGVRPRSWSAIAVRIAA